MVRLVSWNVNGIRAAIANGGLSAVARQRPDLLCLQEVRARPDQIGGVVRTLSHRFHATPRRAGYSGTAIFSRTAPLRWFVGIGERTSDGEGRVVTAEFPSLYVVSVYVPNSQRGLPRLGYRLRWDVRFRKFIADLARTKPVLFCGDLNVAHQEIDIARPRANRMNAGFTDQERRSFSRLLASGFVDTYRQLHPEEAGRYTWWSWATKARERNIGWRIDYVCISESARPRLREAFILDRIRGSDHCPVGVTLDGEL